MAAVEIVGNLDEHFGRHAPNPGARGPCRTAIDDDEALCGLAHFAIRRETGRSCPDDRDLNPTFFPHDGLSLSFPYAFAQSQAHKTAESDTSHFSDGDT